MLGETEQGAKAKTPLNTMNDLKTKALMDTLAESLAEAESKALGNTSKNFYADRLVETLDGNLGVVKVQTVGRRVFPIA